MLMKDDDVAKAGGHSLVECERCSVPLNDTHHNAPHTWSTAGFWSKWRAGEKKTTYPLKHIVHSLLTIIVTWSSMASVTSYLHKIKYLKTVQALWKTAADIKTIRVFEMLPLSLYVLTFTAKVNNTHPPLILTLNIKNICIIKIKWHMSE